jgi:hypothetical protein
MNREPRNVVHEMMAALAAIIVVAGASERPPPRELGCDAAVCADFAIAASCRCMAFPAPRGH